MSTLETSVEQALTALAQAVADKKVTPAAAENIRCWLTEDRYAMYRDETIRHIVDGAWQKLDDVFWTIIPFGTGGRRGRMYPIGSNAINDRTIGESAQGLADYVAEYHGGKKPLSCAIAYDTRHKSRHFTELCAGIMVANGFTVYLLDDYRATPQLSFAVRHLNCDCGIMVTASHNPPSDNAVKVYWSSGAQVLPPHDEGIIARVMDCQEIHTSPFDKALADGKVKIVTEEIDAAYFEAAVACALPGPREAKILYTPLHGVGSAAVLPLLAKDGFTDVEVYGPHAEPSGHFPNVPGHVSNPENLAVFAAPLEYARTTMADLTLGINLNVNTLSIGYCRLEVDVPSVTIDGYYDLDHMYPLHGLTTLGNDAITALDAGAQYGEYVDMRYYIDNKAGGDDTNIVLWTVCKPPPWIGTMHESAVGRAQQFSV